VVSDTVAGQTRSIDSSTPPATMHLHFVVDALLDRLERQRA
jgi:hypothetical protein